MEILIKNKKYHLNYNHTFPEKLSTLKKMITIKMEFEFKEELPEFDGLIVVSKSNRYFWVFTGVQILNKKFNECTYYVGDKVSCLEIEFTFEKVYGSNNKTLIEREIKLNELLN
jgi:hypothetical protein